MILVLVALLLLVAVFAWFRMSVQTWLITAVAVFTLGLFSGGGGTLLSLLLLLVLAPLLVLLFYAPALRKKYLAAPLFASGEKIHAAGFANRAGGH